MNNFYKVVYLGKIKGYRTRPVPVWCEIRYTDGELSISGVVNPRLNGDADSCGQINMGLSPNDFVEFGDGWAHWKVEVFLIIWGEYHLNHMRAGTPAQMRHLEDLKDSGNGFDRKVHEDHYTWAKGVLRDAGLEPDPGYLVERTASPEEWRRHQVSQFFGSEARDLTGEQAFALLQEVLDSDPPSLEGDALQEHQERVAEARRILTVEWNRRDRGKLLLPYCYGEAWLKEEVPEEEMNWLLDIPEAKIQPAWI